MGDNNWYLDRAGSFSHLDLLGLHTGVFVLCELNSSILAEICLPHFIPIGILPLSSFK